MRFRVSITQDQAHRKLCARRPWQGASGDPRPTEIDGRRLPHLELLWMPYYLVTVEVETRRARNELACLVEAIAGQAARLNLEEQTLEPLEDGGAFEPRLGPAEAEATGLEYLRTSLRRLHPRRAPPRFEETRCAVVHYPYWVYYYERRRGKVDMRILDGVTGARGGAGIRIAILEALVALAHPKERQ